MLASPCFLPIHTTTYLSIPSRRVGQVLVGASYITTWCFCKWDQAWSLPGLLAIVDQEEQEMRVKETEQLRQTQSRRSCRHGSGVAAGRLPEGSVEACTSWRALSHADINGGPWCGDAHQLLVHEVSAWMGLGWMIGTGRAQMKALLATVFHPRVSPFYWDWLVEQVVFRFCWFVVCVLFRLFLCFGFVCFLVLGYLSMPISLSHCSGCCNRWCHWYSRHLTATIVMTSAASEQKNGTSGTTNHWKNTAIHDFPDIWRVCIFFLVTNRVLIFFLLTWLL